MLYFFLVKRKAFYFLFFRTMNLSNLTNIVNEFTKNSNGKNTKNNANNKKDEFQKQQAPLKEQLKNTFFLLKNTFKILSRNKDIASPTLRSIYYSLALRVLFFTMLLCFFLYPLLWFLLLFVYIIGAIYKYFYFAKQKSSQSYLVWYAIGGQEASYQQAMDYVKNDFKKYRSIAYIDMARGFIKNAHNSESRWIKWLIRNLLLSGLDEVLDLVSNFLLPVMVIENKWITQVKDDLKAIKDNIPQTLTWVFGIDLLWSAVNKLLSIIYFFIFILGVFIGWILGFTMDTMSVVIGGVTISYLPMLIFVVIVSLVSVIILRLVDGVKVAYFTIFYTNVMKPDIITEDLKEELQQYLQFRWKDEKMKRKSNIQNT